MKKQKCPFCGMPSLVATDVQYFCFSCGMGGDKVSLHRSVDKTTYKKAAEKTQVELISEDSRDEERKDVFKALSLAEQFFFSSKSDYKTSYFEKTRGLKKDTIEKFKLGYSEKGLKKYLLKMGVKEKTLEKAGLISVNPETGKKYEKFWKRVMFPIHDENGNTIGFGGRVLGDEKPKYLNSPETIVFDKSHNLYALNFAKKTNEKYFLLCEGYVDVISLHQAGFSNAIASLGTAFTLGQAELLHKYKNLVYIVYDSDKAGQEATKKAIDILNKDNIKAKVVSIAPYKDVDELLVKAGADEFKKRLDNAIDAERYLVKTGSAEDVVKVLAEKV